MKKICVLLMLIFSINEASYSQDITHEAIIDTLHGFLNEQPEIDKHSKSSVYYVELANFEMLIKQPGIYKFGITSPHSRSYLFIMDNDSIKIINDYSYYYIIQILLSFFNNHKISIDIAEKYSKNTMEAIYRIHNNTFDYLLPDSMIIDND